MYVVGGRPLYAGQCTWPKWSAHRSADQSAELSLEKHALRRDSAEVHLKTPKIATRVRPSVTCEYDGTLSHYAAGSLAVTDLYLLTVLY